MILRHPIAKICFIGKNKRGWLKCMKKSSVHSTMEIRNFEESKKRKGFFKKTISNLFLYFDKWNKPSHFKTFYKPIFVNTLTAQSYGFLFSFRITRLIDSHFILLPKLDLLWNLICNLTNISPRWNLWGCWGSAYLRPQILQIDLTLTKLCHKLIEPVLKWNETVWWIAFYKANTCSILFMSMSMSNLSPL